MCRKTLILTSSQMKVSKRMAEASQLMVENQREENSAKEVSDFANKDQTEPNLA